VQVFTDVTGSPCFPFTMFNPGFLAKITTTTTTTTGRPGCP
jgi:hypothetical protein